MKRIISFALWGTNKKYTIGAIRNAELALSIYPDWICRYYVDLSVPDDILEKLYFFKNTEIIQISKIGDWTMMLDRFQPIEEDDVEVMISRDCDSRLSPREKVAVDEWLASSKMFHTIHDHFHHSVPILGGLFGIKKGLFDELGKYAVEWGRIHESRWQCDQDFLTTIVWPKVKDICLNHAEFHLNIWPGKQIPLPRHGREFIGATYDENDKIDEKQMRCLYG